MKVLITGGAGFLGRGVMRFWPQNEYTVYSRDETKQDVAKQKYKARYVLGDIRDRDRLQYAMKDIDLVVHAGAIKYIPEAEDNVAECINVNIDGSRNVVNAAIAAGVGRVVGVSTDKAVQPVNVYGYTKALMERMFVEANMYSKTTEFSLTRYGNVVGSTGSVVTMFERQLKVSGGVKVTDPDMTRFWQSVEFSVQLIREAAQAPKGTIVIPKAKSMRIGDLAELVANGKPVAIVGARPGEKQHETLLGSYEASKAIDIGWHYLLCPSSKSIASGVKPFSSNDSPLIEKAEMAVMVAEAACI